jgi:ribosomal protein S18 acetylase RimI-like enzyme
MSDSAIESANFGTTGRSPVVFLLARRRRVRPHRQQEVRAMDGGIEEMTSQDYEQVAALWEEVEMWPHVGEDRLWFERALARNPGCALVWRESGRITGTAVGAWDGLRGWIYHLAVTPSHQGHGIGTRLLAAVEERLRARGVQQINLMVYEKNARAEALYRRAGYESSPVKMLRKRFV